MLGFDFHLTNSGPKLIEINTNAGGLATVFTFTVTSEDENGPLRIREKKHITDKFVKAIQEEYKIGYNYIASNFTNSNLPSSLTSVAIIDDNVTTQGLYPEMLEFKRIIEETGVRAVVISPEELTINDDHSLYYNDLKIDFVYNRITTCFRLKIKQYEHLRNASLAGEVVISPHPASYIRIADKRTLPVISDLLRNIKGEAPLFSTIIPQTISMNEKPIDEWIKNRKQWVFKPPEGNGSKGVYRGDKISASKLKTLPMESTLAQQYCPPSVSDDGSKLDFRVFTRDTQVLGLATRHFTGQVMEMRGLKSGFKMALPESVCCFCLLQPEKGETENCDDFCSKANTIGTCTR